MCSSYQPPQANREHLIEWLHDHGFSMFFHPFEDPAESSENYELLQCVSTFSMQASNGTATWKPIKRDPTKTVWEQDEDHVLEAADDASGSESENEEELGGQFDDVQTIAKMVDEDEDWSMPTDLYPPDEEQDPDGEATVPGGAAMGDNPLGDGDGYGESKSGEENAMVAADHPDENFLAHLHAELDAALSDLGHLSDEAVHASGKDVKSGVAACLFAKGKVHKEITEELVDMDITMHRITKTGENDDRKKVFVMGIVFSDPHVAAMWHRGVMNEVQTSGRASPYAVRFGNSLGGWYMRLCLGKAFNFFFLLGVEWLVFCIKFGVATLKFGATASTWYKKIFFFWKYVEELTIYKDFMRDLQAPHAWNMAWAARMWFKYIWCGFSYDSTVQDAVPRPRALYEQGFRQKYTPHLVEWKIRSEADIGKLGGNFQLIYDNNPTSFMPHDCAAETMELELMRLCKMEKLPYRARVSTTKEKLLSTRPKTPGSPALGEYDDTPSARSRLGSEEDLDVDVDGAKPSSFVQLLPLKGTWADTSLYAGSGSHRGSTDLGSPGDGEQKEGEGSSWFGVGGAPGDGEGVTDAAEEGETAAGAAAGGEDDEGETAVGGDSAVDETPSATPGERAVDPRPDPLLAKRAEGAESPSATDEEKRRKIKEQSLKKIKSAAMMKNRTVLEREEVLLSNKVYSNDMILLKKPNAEKVKGFFHVTNDSFTAQLTGMMRLGWADTFTVVVTGHMPFVEPKTRMSLDSDQIPDDQYTECPVGRGDQVVIDGNMMLVQRVEKVKKKPGTFNVRFFTKWQGETQNNIKDCHKEQVCYINKQAHSLFEERLQARIMVKDGSRVAYSTSPLKDLDLEIGTTLKINGVVVTVAEELAPAVVRTQECEEGEFKGQWLSSDDPVQTYGPTDDKPDRPSGTRIVLSHRWASRSDYNAVVHQVQAKETPDFQANLVNKVTKDNFLELDHPIDLGEHGDQSILEGLEVYRIREFVSVTRSAVDVHGGYTWTAQHSTRYPYGNNSFGQLDTDATALRGIGRNLSSEKARNKYEPKNEKDRNVEMTKRGGVKYSDEHKYYASAYIKQPFIWDIVVELVPPNTLKGLLVGCLVGALIGAGGGYVADESVMGTSMGALFGMLLCACIGGVVGGLDERTFRAFMSGSPFFSWVSLISWMCAGTWTLMGVAWVATIWFILKTCYNAAVGKSEGFTGLIERMMAPRVFLHTWYRKHDADPKEDKKTLEEVQKDESAKSFREVKEDEDEDVGLSLTASMGISEDAHNQRRSTMKRGSIAAAPGGRPSGILRQSSQKNMNQNVVGTSAMDKATMYGRSWLYDSDLHHSVLMYFSNSSAVTDELRNYRSLTAQIEDMSVTQQSNNGTSGRLESELRKFIREECASQPNKVVDQDPDEFHEQLTKMLKGAQVGTERFDYEVNPSTRGGCNFISNACHNAKNPVQTDNFLSVIDFFPLFVENFDNPRQGQGETLKKFLDRTIVFMNDVGMRFVGAPTNELEVNKPSLDALFRFIQRGLNSSYRHHCLLKDSSTNSLHSNHRHHYKSLDSVFKVATKVDREMNKARKRDKPSKKDRLEQRAVNDEAYASHMDARNMANKWVMFMMMVLAFAHKVLGETIMSLYDCTYQESTQRTSLDAVPEYECCCPGGSSSLSVFCIWPMFQGGSKKIPEWLGGDGSCEEHYALLVYAWYFSFVYMLGIPLLFLYLIYFKVIRTGHMFRREEKARYGYSYQKYTEQCWYWEVVSMMLKLALGTWFMWTSPYTETPIEAGGVFLIFLFMWFVQMNLMPFLELKFNKCQALAYTHHIFFCYCATMFKTEKMNTGSELTSVFMIVIFTLYTCKYLFTALYDEVSASLPPIKKACDPDTWILYVKPLAWAQARYVIKGAKYRTEFYRSFQALYDWVEPTFEDKVREAIVDRVKTTRTLGPAGLFWSKFWIRDLGTSMREGAIFAEWLEEFMMCADRSTFDQLIQKDWETNALPQDEYRDSRKTTIKKFGQNMWEVVFAKALRLYSTHGTSPNAALDNINPREYSGGLLPRPSKDRDDVGSKLLENVLYKDGRVFSVESADIESVLDEIYVDIAMGEYSCEGARYRLYADVEQHGKYELVSGDHRPKFTFGFWKLQLQSAYKLEAGKMVQLRDHSKELNGRKGRIERAGETKGKWVVDMISMPFDKKKIGKVTCKAANIEVVPEEYEVLSTHLRVYSVVDVAGTFNQVTKESIWWPALITDVDATKGHYFVMDSAGSDAVRSEKAYRRSELRPAGNVMGSTDEVPIGYIWKANCADNDKQEKIPLLRGDVHGQLVIDQELVTFSQIEWLQSRLLTAPLALGGANDGAWVVAAFADGTCDVWRQGDGEKVHSLVHGLPVRHIYISPDGSTILTFSDRDVIMWNVPEDKENDPARIVYLNGRKEMVTQKDTVDGKGKMLPTLAKPENGQTDVAASMVRGDDGKPLKAGVRKQPGDRVMAQRSKHHRLFRGHVIDSRFDGVEVRYDLAFDDPQLIFDEDADERIFYPEAFFGGKTQDMVHYDIEPILATACHSETEQSAVSVLLSRPDALELWHLDFLDKFGEGPMIKWKNHQLMPTRSPEEAAQYTRYLSGSVPEGTDTIVLDDNTHVAVGHAVKCKAGGLLPGTTVVEVKGYAVTLSKPTMHAISSGALLSFDPGCRIIDAKWVSSKAFQMLDADGQDYLIPRRLVLKTRTSWFTFCVDAKFMNKEKPLEGLKHEIGPCGLLSGNDEDGEDRFFIFPSPTKHLTGLLVSFEADATAAGSNNDATRVTVAQYVLPKNSKKKKKKRVGQQQHKIVQMGNMLMRSGEPWGDPAFQYLLSRMVQMEFESPAPPPNSRKFGAISRRNWYPTTITWFKATADPLTDGFKKGSMANMAFIMARFKGCGARARKRVKAREAARKNFCEGVMVEAKRQIAEDTFALALAEVLKEEEEERELKKVEAESIAAQKAQERRVKAQEQAKKRQALAKAAQEAHHSTAAEEKGEEDEEDEEEDSDVEGGGPATSEDENDEAEEGGSGPRPSELL